MQNGTLKIIDRKKHIFKLAQGEYISPEKIENIYIRSEPVAQLYVHGDSLQVINQHTNTRTSVSACLVLILRSEQTQMTSTEQKSSLFLFSFQSFLVGIIVPDPEVMPEWAKKKGIVGTYKDLCENLVGGSPNLPTSANEIDVQNG